MEASEDRPSPEDSGRDLFAAALAGGWGLLATLGGAVAAVSGHAHGGRLAGAAEVVYGLALLWVAWTLIRRLTWSTFLLGAPLLLIGDALDSWLYGGSRGPWPNFLILLVVAGWLWRLLRRPQRRGGMPHTAAPTTEQAAQP